MRIKPIGAVTIPAAVFTHSSVAVADQLHSARNINGGRDRRVA